MGIYLEKMMTVNFAGDDCKHCTNVEGEPVKGRKHVELKNGDTIYRCLNCKAMWGVDKNGERLDG